jgi:hypothetical protein
VETTRNSKNIALTENGITHGCRVLNQIITAPDGSKMLIVQEISNTSDYHDINFSPIK